MSQQATTVKVTYVTVPAATSTLLIAQNQIRKSLVLYNSGANAAYLNYNLPAAAQGIPIPGNGATASQRTFGPNTGVPTDNIFAYSTAGTTFVIEEGN